MKNLHELVNSSNLVSKVELEPIIDTKKSFYKKAKVFTMSNGDTYLVSYSTVVASIKNGIANIEDTYSMTTLRHIRDFLYQNGFEIGNKKFITDTYC